MKRTLPVSLAALLAAAGSLIAFQGAGDPNAQAQAAQQALGGGRGGGGQAPMVESGRYTATLGKVIGDSAVPVPVGKPQSFQVTPLLPRNFYGG